MTIDMHIEIDANYYAAMDAGLRGLACYEDRSWTVEYLSASTPYIVVSNDSKMLVVSSGAVGAYVFVYKCPPRSLVSFFMPTEREDGTALPMDQIDFFKLQFTQNHDCLETTTTDISGATSTDKYIACGLSDQ